MATFSLFLNHNLSDFWYVRLTFDPRSICYKTFWFLKGIFFVFFLISTHCTVRLECHLYHTPLNSDSYPSSALFNYSHCMYKSLNSIWLNLVSHLFCIFLSFPLLSLSPSSSLSTLLFSPFLFTLLFFFRQLTTPRIIWPSESKFYHQGIGLLNRKKKQSSPSNLSRAKHFLSVGKSSNNIPYLIIWEHTGIYLWFILDIVLLSEICRQLFNIIESYYCKVQNHCSPESFFMYSIYLN